MTSSAPEEPVAGAAHAASVPSRSRFNPGWGLIIIGGLLGVLGAFMTWATVDYGGVATHTYRGVSGGRDGKITVVLSVLVLGLTVLAFLGWAARRWMLPALAILGLLIAFVAIADLAASPSAGSQQQALLDAHVTSSNGIGEWLTLFAGILVLVGVWLVMRYSRSPSAEAAAIQTIASSSDTAHEAPADVEPSAEDAAEEPSPDAAGDATRTPTQLAARDEPAAESE